MLVFMHFQPFLIAAHPHPGLDINIVVHTMHIGIGMVYNIVFVMPDKTVSAKHSGKAAIRFTNLLLLKLPCRRRA
jgi:hypothetical protein